MTKLKAFLMGVWEFRTSWTTSYPDLELAYSYDLGREFAHQSTLRYFERD